MKEQKDKPGSTRSTLVRDKASCESVGDRLISQAEVAERLGICVRTVSRLVAAGVFPPPLKIGKASKWCEADVTDYVNRLKSLRDSRRHSERGAA